MTAMRQPTKAELSRLRSQCLRVAKKLGRTKPAMAAPASVIKAGDQDCYDATVEALGYDPLADVDALDTAAWGAGVVIER